MIKMSSFKLLEREYSARILFSQHANNTSDTYPEYRLYRYTLSPDLPQSLNTHIYLHMIMAYPSMVSPNSEYDSPCHYEYDFYDEIASNHKYHTCSKYNRDFWHDGILESIFPYTIGWDPSQ